MKNNLSICVLGDIMLDVVTRVPALGSDALDGSNEFSRSGKIDMYAGGTGTHLARAAALEGFESVSLIGKIGVQPQNAQPDVAAQMVIRELQSYGVQGMLACDEQLSTGTAMLVYFADDKRLMIYDRGANSTFAMRDLTLELYDAVARVNILFVSGYTLLVPDQAAAVVQLMQEGQSHNCLVVLDVVPHNLYQKIDSSTFRSYTRHVDIIISEISALKQLFPAIRTLNAFDQTEAIAHYLTSYYRAVILNIRDGMQYIYDKYGLVGVEDTECTGAGFEKGLSYLERFSLKMLQKHYLRLVKGAETNVGFNDMMDETNKLMN